VVQSKILMLADAVYNIINLPTRFLHC
jgi:hypothetical protein